VVKSQIPLRAAIQQSRILDKEIDITILRFGNTLEPQTVRLELEENARSMSDDSGEAFSIQATVFGIHGHPTLPDTDIKVWDTFRHDGMEFTVRVVNRQTHGQIQAYCEGV
jgi:hypothetical protein